MFWKADNNVAKLKSLSEFPFTNFTRDVPLTFTTSSFLTVGEKEGALVGLKVGAVGDMVG